MATTATTKTYDDLCRMPEDGNRYELIAGEMLVSPAPNEIHQELVLRLAIMLRTFVLARKLGRVVIAPFDVLFSPTDVVEPDVLFVSNARLGIMKGNHAEGAPDLVVEVQSPSTSRIDEGRKLQLYAKYRVLEYWLADSVSQRFRALFLTPGGYRPIPQDGRIVRSRVLPGLEIDVVELFADLP